MLIRHDLFTITTSLRTQTIYKHNPFVKAIISIIHTFLHIALSLTLLSPWLEKKGIMFGIIRRRNSGSILQYKLPKNMRRQKEQTTTVMNGGKFAKYDDSFLSISDAYK